MNLQGKVIAALPPRVGTSANGEWKSQDFVIEIPGQYPKKMLFSVFGQERLDKFNIQIGQEVDVYFEIDAHEWNGKWFSDIRAYDVRLAWQAAQQPTQMPQSTQNAVNMAQQAFGGGLQPVAQPQTAPQQGNEQLPF